MRKNRNSLQYLADMLQYARQARVFISGYARDDYFADAMRKLALLHAIQIVGEAAGKVERDVREQLPDIPWRKISDCRNIIAHDYDDIEEPVVWLVVTEHLPPLIQTLETYFQVKGITI